jgi:hypothetical protein
MRYMLIKRERVIEKVSAIKRLCWGERERERELETVGE